MDFGVNLLTRGITGNADGLLSMARQAEALGFGHVTVNDHIVVPNRIASRYPYTPTGEWPGARAGECLEQVTALGFLAAATSAHPPRHLRDGGAAASGRAGRQGAGHRRRAVAGDGSPSASGSAGSTRSSARSPRRPSRSAGR